MPVVSYSDRMYEYSYLAPARAALRVKVSSSEFLLTDGSDSRIDERGHVFSITTPSLEARTPALPNIRFPFTAPRFGPQPVVIPVKIRGKKVN